MLLIIGGTILKLMLVVILIGVMIVALMGINCLIELRSDKMRDDRERQLRDDLENNRRVIPRDSVFHNFLAREGRRRSRRESHKSAF